MNSGNSAVFGPAVVNRAHIYDAVPDSGGRIENAVPQRKAPLTGSGRPGTCKVVVMAAACRKGAALKHNTPDGGGRGVNAAPVRL